MYFNKCLTYIHKFVFLYGHILVFVYNSTTSVPWCIYYEPCSNWCIQWRQDVRQRAFGVPTAVLLAIPERIVLCWLFRRGLRKLGSTERFLKKWYGVSSALKHQQIIDCWWTGSYIFDKMAGVCQDPAVEEEWEPSSAISDHPTLWFLSLQHTGEKYMKGHRKETMYMIVYVLYTRN